MTICQVCVWDVFSSCLLSVSIYDFANRYFYVSSFTKSNELEVFVVGLCHFGLAFCIDDVGDMKTLFPLLPNSFTLLILRIY